MTPLEPSTPIEGEENKEEETPALKNGWVTDNGDTYYYIDDVLQTGLIEVEGQKYLMNAEGVMQVGLQEIDGNTYYFGSDGAMQKGQVSVGESTKYFDKQGILVENGVASRNHLIDYLKDTLSSRHDEVTIKYYGDDLVAHLDFHNVSSDVIASGTYHNSNIDSIGYLISEEDGFLEVTFIPEYRTTDKEEEFIQDAVERISNELITEDMSDYEKARVLHDYVVDNTVYNPDTVNSEYSPCTLFKEGGGVCNAYALAYGRLLDYNNIENLFVGGVGNDVAHAWNKVKIDGEWYNVDTTWSFPKSEHGLHSAYYYFMVSDERLYETHTPDAKELLPESTNTQYDGMYDNNYDTHL